MPLNPYFWLVLVALVAGAGTAGFLKGREWEQGRQAVKELNRTAAVIKLKEVVYKKDNSVVAAHEQEKAELKDEINGLRREYAALRGELDKRAGVCDLPAPVLGVLNRARRGTGPAADPGKPAPAVPAPASAPER